MVPVVVTELDANPQIQQYYLLMKACFQLTYAKKVKSIYAVYFVDDF
jgi:hypothetical protein